jgi:2,3-bisphosphoglycerate-independent phosphoglycerate mutase
MYPLGPGIVPGSDTSHLSLFGYDPRKYYCGRGVFEALGAGIALKKGDVAFRCNFATVDAQMNILDRRAGRIGTDDAASLGRMLDGMKLKGAEATFKSTVEHRGALVLHGSGLSPDISPTDPHGEGKVQQSKGIDAAGKKTADALNAFTKKSFDILDGALVNKERKSNGLQPANIVLSRGAGTLCPAPSFYEKYNLNAACVAGGSLYKGVAAFAGMKVLDVKGASGTANTDLDAKVAAVEGALLENDFVFMHVKATDNFGHDGDFDGKKAMIEKIDAAVGRLMALGATVVVTGDHSTPCKLKAHSAHPVPVGAWGKYVRSDSVLKFDEISCAGGQIGNIHGLELMPSILCWMNAAPMHGT